MVSITDESISNLTIKEKVQALLQLDSTPRSPPNCEVFSFPIATPGGEEEGGNWASSGTCLRGEKILVLLKGG